MKSKRKRQVYTNVIEGEEQGRSRAGWYLGIALEDEPGYCQLKPGFGPYVNQEAARDHAAELNASMGLSAEDAFRVVMSTMRATPRTPSSGRMSARRIAPVSRVGRLP